MSLALLHEDLIQLSTAAKLAGEGRKGKPVNLATVWRWCLHGVTIGSGEKVFLESIRIGKSLKTSRQAWERFVVAQNEAPEKGDESAPVRTPTQRQKASERAEKILEKMGV